MWLLPWPPLPSTADLPSLPPFPIRYNDFLHDPLSLCKECSPQPNGENAISARSDLNPANGSYPFPALRQRSHGGIDVKVLTRPGEGAGVGSVTIITGMGREGWGQSRGRGSSQGHSWAVVGPGPPGLGQVGAQPRLVLSSLLCPRPQVTSMALAKAFRFLAASGPTWDQVPPFQWSASPFSGLLHMGQPDLWKFLPIEVWWD